MKNKNTTFENIDILKSEIKKLAKFYSVKVKKIRESIHRNPELSFKEYNTSLLIKTILEEENVYYDSILETGIVAKIEGNKPDSKSIALRAELDALPIQEKNFHDYSSRNKNIMHACGHDVHLACLLGAIFILNEIKSSFEGTIYFIFQPGEELNPGGASLMIENGIFNIVKSDFFIAQHVSPELNIGKVGFCNGISMASCDDFTIEIKGSGGHGAMPHLCIDPIVISSHVILGIQQLVSRTTSPLDPVVITIGEINTIGGATNIIPNKVVLNGTLRVFDEKTRIILHEKIDQIVNGFSLAMGAESIITIDEGYPSLKNNDLLSGKCFRVAQNFMGKENVLKIDKRMTSEDFAFFSKKKAACFYRIGTQSKNGDNSSQIHTSSFDVDEGIYEIGMGLMTFIALQVAD